MSIPEGFASLSEAKRLELQLRTRTTPELQQMAQFQFAKNLPLKRMIAMIIQERDHRHGTSKS